MGVPRFSLYALILLSVPACLLAYQSDKYIGTQGPSDDYLWESYKDTYKKTYTETEERHRRQIWEDNVRYIQKHNVEFDLGKHSFTLGVNQYADWSLSEYRKYLLDTEPQNVTWSFAGYTPDLDSPLPQTVDWTKKGYVTAVKHQEQCGSCWAFSATGALEGQHFRATGRLVSLSEQNLIDCSGPFGNFGCNGGLKQRAFQYIIANGGIDTESSYPYEARNGPCRFKRSAVGAKMSAFKMVTPVGSETALQAATATIGPIGVSIDASQRSFQHYKSGVYNEPLCSSSKTGHAVLAVGYGSQNGRQYWLVKNSWGQGWGQGGYIMMSRNMGNQCAIASAGYFPVV